MIIADVLFDALGQAAPRRAIAAGGPAQGIIAAGHDPQRNRYFIDYENFAAISDDLKEKLREKLIAAGAAADAIIISDYNCGTVLPQIFEAARNISNERGIPLIVDSRYRLCDFPNAATATPNREEVEKILGENFSAEDCARLRERLGYDALLLQTDRFFDRDLIERVHRHLDVGRLDTGVVGLDADLDVVIDDPFDPDQHFHRLRL